MEKFAIGLVVGGVCGALLTANNYKMRTLVKKAQQDMQKKLDSVMDEKICAMENCITEQNPDEERETVDKRGKKREK